MRPNILKILAILLLSTAANAQVVRMTSGDSQWTGFAISPTEILTVAHPEAPVAIVHLSANTITADRTVIDAERDVAVYKCRIPHGQKVLKLAKSVTTKTFKLVGYAGVTVRNTLCNWHSKIVKAVAKPSGEEVLPLGGKAYMGMSGSPVTDPETGEVVGIQSAGSDTLIICVSLDQIRKVLNATTE